MTIRAFLLGLLAVVALCALDPYTSFNKGYGWLTVGHFPPGAVFYLVIFTLGLNLLIKLVKKSWALRQAELLLIWCMLIVACIVPSDGLERWWCPMLAGPSYIARRADIPWQETSLTATPDGLLLSEQPGSVAAKHYYEGSPETVRIPWRLWLPPLGRWALFMAFFYGAVFFLCGILRKQWVDRERLQFPLARIPMEFTEGAGGRTWLPTIFRDKGFLLGLLFALVFRFLRDLPLIFGKDAGWSLNIPLQTVFKETALQPMGFQDFGLWWSAIGFAYLVPADVSLSIWFFYLFGRTELLVSALYGSTLHQGGTWSQLMNWQIAGSYMAFAVGTIFMTRRHLWDVTRKALGMGRGIDDSAEPVSFRVGFWGFAICIAGALGWFWHYGMTPWAAAILLMTLMCIMIVNAKLVAQSGVYITTCLWSPPAVLHGLSFARLFGTEGMIVAQMQSAIMINSNYCYLSPQAVHAFRISEVFDRYRRLLLPALFIALFVGIAASTYTCLWMGYKDGAASYADDWGPIGNPRWSFESCHQKMERPTDIDPARWTPFLIGIGLTGAVMFLRAGFYWWPIHPIGLLAISNWHADRIWLPFMLGWMIKVALMKFGSGRMVRAVRTFFIAFILSEYFVDGCSTIVVWLSAGTVKGF